jgi:D-serine deaminase-like pyridoxal phosphate-dependent protein
MITSDSYYVADPKSLETPAMLLFPDVMDHNISTVCEMVGGGENLIAHVKTHKSEAVARKELKHGIAGFKCATLKELEMVLQAGAQKAILAYPQVQQRKVERLFDLALRFPDAWVAAIVSSLIHLELLSVASRRRKQALHVMLDIDAGMHRTGIGYGPDSTNLYRNIDADPFLVASGFHFYDGHENYSDEREREATVQGHIQTLQAYQQQIEAAGVAVPYVVAGGSWSFPYYARTEGIYGSPGTFVYWDAGNRKGMPDMNGTKLSHFSMYI